MVHHSLSHLSSKVGHLLGSSLKKLLSLGCKSTEGLHSAKMPGAEFPSAFCLSAHLHSCCEFIHFRFCILCCFCSRASLAYQQRVLGTLGACRRLTYGTDAEGSHDAALLLLMLHHGHVLSS